MAYTESLFCFVTILFLFGISQKWPIWVLAAITGLATAVRPVGIALSISLWWFLLTQPFPSGWSINKKPKKVIYGIGKIAAIVSLSCWGILLYMAYLEIRFDDPFAFFETQKYWTQNARAETPFIEKITALVRFDPIINTYDPESPRFWVQNGDTSNAFFNLAFWNPILYLLAWVIIGYGSVRRWLTSTEICLSIGLLIIPYATRGFEMTMASHARFATVVIPQYFVLGRLFAMMPPAIAGCLCGLMGLMLGLWTALFVAGYRFF